MHPDKPLTGEVYSEVAATRLLWALGFQSDVMYPARVICRGCPADPFADSKDNWKKDHTPLTGATVFPIAAIERTGGSAIETPGYEGWAWPELDMLQVSSEQRARLDALKLLAVFIQHSDSKPQQQELVCDDGAKRKQGNGSETCASAWLVIKDLGVTFGKATRLNNSKMIFADWSSVPVWADEKQCIGNLPRSLTGSLDNPRVSEGGRALLATQLGKLRDIQIRDLFVVSNVVKRGEQIEVDGKKRSVTVDDWVRAFKKKRAEIASAHCPA